MAVRILKCPAVLSATGLSKTDLYARIRNGKFPPPLRLGERSVGWRSDQVEAWIEALPVADGQTAASRGKRSRNTKATGA